MDVQPLSHFRVLRGIRTSCPSSRSAGMRGSDASREKVRPRSGRETGLGHARERCNRQPRTGSSWLAYGEPV